MGLCWCYETCWGCLESSSLSSVVLVRGCHTIAHCSFCLYSLSQLFQASCWKAVSGSIAMSKEEFAIDISVGKLRNSHQSGRIWFGADIVCRRQGRKPSNTFWNYILKQHSLSREDEKMKQPWNRKSWDWESRCLPDRATNSYTWLGAELGTDWCMCYRFAAESMPSCSCIWGTGFKNCPQSLICCRSSSLALWKMSPFQFRFLYAWSNRLKAKLIYLTALPEKNVRKGADLLSRTTPFNGRGQQLPQPSHFSYSHMSARGLSSLGDSRPL